MNLTITGKNIPMTEGLKSYVNKKMERVKYFFPHMIDVHVVMEVEKLLQKIEINIKSDGKIFHSEFKAGDMYGAIDGLVDRVEKQIRRYKEKLHDFNSERVSLVLEEKHDDRPDFVFTKVREIQPKPMSDEEAVLQLKKSEFRFNIYKKSEISTMEDYKKLLENDSLIPYVKTVMIKEENNQFIVVRKINDSWTEETLMLDGENVKSQNNSKHIEVEDKSIEEAVKTLVEKSKKYLVFYDKDHKQLTIIYKRRDNTLGLISSSNHSMN
ncbi:MAG TPA: ribosome-associated translation inhibitor RaiA [Spirochaetia bacterium]|nr:MAG: ribosomal subunit interface protein [Spirochaetes bacterium GWB1_36_13]HCL56280.1 ribosome-associated translation inhibitor RaiA [Spirochaetia bacterium]